MFSASEFRELVSGRRRGLGPALLRTALRGCEFPYAAAIRYRNRRYDTGRAVIHRVGIPVVSVGNVTTGGTGKTPMVEWIARWFRTRHVRVALISRGYGAERGSVNDEALELEEKLPDVPHLQDPDRVKIARIAVDELESQLLVLDDGFQHRRLHRDLEIVLIDALDPFGGGHLLPRGLLREPLAGLGRADVVALTRADQISDTERGEIQQRVEQFAPQAVWIEVVQEPKSLISADGREQPLATLSEQRVLAFCGIGSPLGFRKTLERCGVTVEQFREFADHYRYGRDDIQLLGDWVEAGDGIDALVCTHKDLVKIRLNKIASRPLWALRIGVEIRFGRDQLESKLAAMLPGEPGALPAG